MRFRCAPPQVWGRASPACSVAWRGIVLAVAPLPLTADKRRRHCDTVSEAVTHCWGPAVMTVCPVQDNAVLLLQRRRLLAEQREFCTQGEEVQISQISR